MSDMVGFQESGIKITAALRRTAGHMNALKRQFGI